MIKLFFVGDGPRDEAVVPHLVAKILALDALQSGFSPWASLHKKSKGYARKLRFAIRQARDQNALGLVATVDSDESGRSGRLNQLRDGRDEDRQSAPPFPTALGEAIPHLEAWLIDDPVAVCAALHLAADATVLTVRQTKDPKSTINELSRHRADFENVVDALEQIARRVEPSRCAHEAETGFKAFVADVKHELSPLCSDS